MATTKKSTKKSVKKSAATTTRGNTYVLTAKGQTELAEVSGQGELIRNTLRSKSNSTAADLLTRMGKKLDAPNPAKTLAFYLSIWKKAGFVKFGSK